MSNACEVARQAEVPSAMSNLGYEISTLEGLIKDLKERLAPVRSNKAANPISDKKLSAAAVISAAITSPLASNIQAHGEQLAALNVVLRGIHDELEL